MGAHRPSGRAQAALHLGDGGTRLIAAVVPLVPAWGVDRPFDYLVPDDLVDRVSEGTLVRVSFGHRRVRAVVVDIAERAPDRELAPIGAVVAPVPVCPPPLPRLVQWVARRYVAPHGQAFTRVVPPRVRVKVAPIARLEGGPSPEILARYRGGKRLVEAIEGAATGVWCVRRRAGENAGGLVCEIAAAAGRADGSAIVAVPEVRYGSPVVDALGVIWPDIAHIDTATPPAERAAGLLRLAEGHGLGAGGRAAVFAAAPNLRVLIVDDAHHPSFKEERAPRYDARRAAVERARLQGMVCVLISPTPPAEIGAAAARGSIGWVEPLRRDDRDARPLLEVIPPASDRAISHGLHSRIRDALRAGERVGLLAPRRGFARALWCAQCRRSLRCPECEAGLFFDRGSNVRVRCARCGFVAGPPDVCPTCGATEWRYVGAGSERLAEQLGAAFPRARVARVDPDVLNESEPHELALDQADIYVTTWIGTKPAVRPKVSLVAVLDADALIRRPDFRAAERSYQALAEMAEWAGPASAGGRMVVESAEPSHPAVQAIARADYRFWLDRELEERRELGYPPFSELVKVTTRGDDGDRAIAAAADACGSVGARVLGPITVTTHSGRVRQILVKHSSALEVADELRVLAAGARGENRLQIDVDPR
jgi:primosomal protein N' (replication factor Y) (superfamily II helicase)